ncbi:hypothetical protein MTO96_003756 [Rhipicephalus appendiculatus]
MAAVRQMSVPQAGLEAEERARSPSRDERRGSSSPPALGGHPGEHSGRSRAAEQECLTAIKLQSQAHASRHLQQARGRLDCRQSDHQLLGW